MSGQNQIGSPVDQSQRGKRAVQTAAESCREGGERGRTPGEATPSRDERLSLLAIRRP